MTTLRPGTEGDLELIAGLIRALAEYERLSDDVTFDEDVLRRNLFGPRPYAETLIAEVDGTTAGFALYFHNFSTFMGKPGIYLEDLFVKPEHRGAGIGRALLAGLAAIAIERDCGRLEWSVLNWNEDALGFYRRLGAKPNSEWTVYRLAGEPLTSLATS